MYCDNYIKLKIDKLGRRSFWSNMFRVLTRYYPAEPHKQYEDFKSLCIIAY